MKGSRTFSESRSFRRFVGCSVFYCFTAVLSYAIHVTGYSRGDQYYEAYPAETGLLGDSDKVFQCSALGNCFEAEEWGPIEFCIMSKHFERQGKQYAAYLLSLGQLDGSA
ncbi:hypothetical protein ACJRO7_012126 [Eucalyptus globulus]|uniref:Uncharacterized protein n=1 Tax=Eucalyptus globulus TaxID=34317 RepID=A0ABD3LLY5_EUCGL